MVYAREIQRVAEFYRRTLALATLEEEAHFILLGDAHVEVAIVSPPASLAASISIDVPPRQREDTPIKCSYRVDDLERVRREAMATGGGLQPAAAAWRWRGHLYLDGHDPEGNIVQFRQRDA